MLHHERRGPAAVAAMMMLMATSGCEGPLGREADDGELRGARVIPAIADPGACLFARQLASPPAAEASRMNALALGPGGEIVLAGGLRGAVDFGAGDLSPEGGSDAFVVKLAPCGGVAWQKVFGDSGEQTALDVAVSPNGDVIVMGSFKGTIDLGAGPLTAANHPFNAFLARLDRHGKAVWTRHVTGAHPSAIAVDSAGNTLFLGSFDGVASFGDKQVESTTAAGVAAKIDPAGHTLWSVRLPTTVDEDPRDIEVAPSGDIFVAGEDARGHGLFVLALAPTGDLVWKKRFFAIQQTDEQLTDLTVSHAGRARLAGAGYLGDIHEPDARHSPFVAELDDSGDVEWISRGDVSWHRITATSSGTTLAAGTSCSPDGATCELVSSELDPSGDEVWSDRFEGSAQLSGLEADAHRVVLAGSFEAKLRLSPEPLQITGSALFVAAVRRPGVAPFPGPDSAR